MELKKCVRPFRCYQAFDNVFFLGDFELDHYYTFEFYFVVVYVWFGRVGVILLNLDLEINVIDDPLSIIN